MPEQPRKAGGLGAALPQPGKRIGEGAASPLSNLTQGPPKKRGGKGAASPQQGGGRGRGLQAPAHEGRGCPRGTGRALSATRTPRRDSGPQGGGRNGAGREREGGTTNAPRRGGGRGPGRGPRGEPRADAPPPRP